MLVPTKAGEVCKYKCKVEFNIRFGCNNKIGQMDKEEEEEMIRNGVKQHLL